MNLGWGRVGWDDVTSLELCVWWGGRGPGGLMSRHQAQEWGPGVKFSKQKVPTCTEVQGSA